MNRGRLVGLTVLLVASNAHASNGIGRRTPAVYPRARCIASVDRSVDPIFHLDIGLPQEDLMLTPDEPPDSRRLQFFAACEDLHRELLSLPGALPNWVAQADVDTALELGLIDEAPPSQDVLASSAWADCAFAMNEADARIPISCEATQAGLDFDTRALEAGNYVIRGYTYEPALNLWSMRPGVLSVHDGTPPPSVGLVTPALDGRQVRRGDPFPIEGCAAGPEGTRVLLQWASLLRLGGEDDEAQWHTFATLDASEGSFSVPFDPPEEAVNTIALVRAVVDPDGPARWVDLAEGTLQVFGDDASSDEPFGEPIEVCGFYPPEEGSTGELTSGSPESDDDAGGVSAGADDSGEGGCACTSGRGRPVGPISCLVVMLILRRRRVR